MKKLTLIVPALILLCYQISSGQETPRILYQKDSLGYFEKHIKITKLDSLPEAGSQPKQIRNSAGSAGFYLVESDFTKPGPWNSTAIVANVGERTLYKFEFLDHASYGVRMEWVNDKLLHAKVFLGRIIALDFIFDTVTGKVIYGEVEDSTNIVYPDQR